MKVIKSKRLGEKMVFHELKNGVQVIFIPKKGFQRRIASINVKYGSIDITFRHNGQVTETPHGIAHFLEHQLFKKNDMDALAEVSRFGAQANAYTDYSQTCYYFSTTENFDPSLELLLDFVFTPDFAAERVERERAIITQELLMYSDNPDHKCYQGMMNSLFINHPAKFDIGGTPESVSKITRDQIEKCYFTFYTPANLFMVLAGEIDEDKALRMIETKIKAGHPPPIRQVAPDKAGVASSSSEAKAIVSMPKVMIGFKDLSIPSDLREALFHEIVQSYLMDLIFGRTSHFYSTAYREGIIDEGFDASYKAEPTFALTVIGAETAHRAKFVDSVHDAIERARREGFKSKDFTRIRKKTEGRIVKAFDSPGSAAGLATELQIKGLNYLDFLDVLGMVSKDRLEEALGTAFDEKNKAISVVHP